MKIASLVLGIIALIFCWVPFFGLTLSIIAVVISIIALVMAKKDPKNKGMAIAGIVCSIIAIITSGLLTFGIFMAGNYLKSHSNEIIQELQSVSDDFEEKANSIVQQATNQVNQIQQISNQVEQVQQTTSTVNEQQVKDAVEAAQAQLEAVQKQLESQGL